MRSLFFLDRWNGSCWTTLFSAPTQIGPGDLHGLDGETLAGLPGSKARVRVDETVVEEFDWALIPANPLDPNSDQIWGWKSLGRHYESIPAKFREETVALSFLG